MDLKLGFKADERDYKVVGYILKDLGINEIKLMTNNPKKIQFVESCGIKINQRTPSITKTNEYNKNYLKIKKEQMGHLL